MNKLSWFDMLDANSSMPFQSRYGLFVKWRLSDKDSDLATSISQFVSYLNAHPVTRFRVFGYPIAGFYESVIVPTKETIAFGVWYCVTTVTISVPGWMRRAIPDWLKRIIFPGETLDSLSDYVVNNYRVYDRKLSRFQGFVNNLLTRG